MNEQTELAAIANIRRLSTTKHQFFTVLSALDHYISTYPEGDAIREVLIRRGDILAEMGFYLLARRVYDQIIADWPDSTEAALSSLRIEECKRSARREGRY